MLVHHQSESPAPYSVTVYHNARIFTAAPQQPWATALAVGGGRILAIGTENHVHQQFPAPQHIVDLQGTFVAPGFCDSHIHLYETILAARSVQSTGSKSLDDMLHRIRTYIQQRLETSSPGHTPTQDEWIRGQGWNESRWPEPQYPQRMDLDAATGMVQPAIFWRSDMHVAVCNTPALQRSGITATTPDPPGGAIGRAADGTPNGILYDTAIDLVARAIPPLDGDLLAAGILDAGARLRRLGITSIHDQRLQNGHDGPRMLRAYAALHAQGKLPLRIHCNIGGTYLDHALALGLTSGLGDEWLRIGHVKYFIDGSLGSRTAWMLEPYAHDPAHDSSHGTNPGATTGDTEPPTHATGLCVTPPHELRQAFARALAGDLSISVHAIGDRGNREVLDIFEELLPQYPTPLLPHRIEHVQILAPEDMERLARLNLTASVQPVHALDDIEIARRYLGIRGAYTYAFQTLLAAGTRLAFGSDAPVADPNPLLGIHAAVLRRRPGGGDRDIWHASQAIDLTAALHAYTTGAAAAVSYSHAVGSLQAGKLADFVLLSQDPFEHLHQRGDAANLAEIDILATVLNGIPVYNSFKISG